MRRENLVMKGFSDMLTDVRLGCKDFPKIDISTPHWRGTSVELLETDNTTLTTGSNQTYPGVT